MILTVVVKPTRDAEEFLDMLEYHLETPREQDETKPNRFTFRSAVGFSQAADTACATNKGIVKSFGWW